MIGDSIRRAIGERLAAIERQEKVQVLFACESGSRAWGFASINSDYDVRFIYLRPRDWYLSIDVERRSDVIERPLEDEIDLSGWDLRKALALFAKSNPPLLEWIVSPIIYLDRCDLREGLQALLPEYYSPVACAHHYLNMAQNNYRDFFSGPMVKQKKYFYVLRPILAIEWIARGLGPVPMEFGVLVERIIGNGQLRDEIQALIESKRSGLETSLAPRNEIVCEFITQELQRFEASLPALDPARGNTDLNVFFRNILDAIPDR